MPQLLAADIGGSKCDLAVYDLSLKTVASPIRHKRYQNRDFPGFDEILNNFLHDIQVPEYACFGVAAVIHRGTAALTNRNWIISEKELKQSFAFNDIILINDLTALCSALPFLTEDDLFTIQQGTLQKNNIRAVIAPGTGLGEGFLVKQGSCFFPQGTEGGHCDFAPLNDEQAELLRFLQARYTSVSYELLCSGIGIPNIFDFLASNGVDGRQSQLDTIAMADDRTPPILAGATDKTPCPLCQRTLTLFLEILGAEAGNLSLKICPTGGLFIGGGILPRIVKHISFDPFLRAFREKEKMHSLMRRFPIQLILRKKPALFGTACYGHHFFNT